MVDTLKYNKKLKQAGMSQAHSEAIIYTQREMLMENAAKTEDIEKLRSEMATKFTAIEGKFGAIDEKFVTINEKFKSLENRMTVKLGSIMAVGVGLILASGWYS